MLDNTSLVGKIKASKMPYYDNKARTIKFKARPVLILKAERDSGNSDFTVLPISSVSFQQNINKSFDLEVTKKAYPLLNLTKNICYIRCGKIMTLNKSDLATSTISDLRGEYPELWASILEKVNLYISTIK